MTSRKEPHRRLADHMHAAHGKVWSDDHQQYVAEAIRRGRGTDPKPMNQGDDVPRLMGCPDCGGRGYFLIRPFMTGGSNGAGGLGNMTHCLTCVDSKAYYEQHGELPPEIVEAMEAKKAGDTQ